MSAYAHRAVHLANTWQPQADDPERLPDVTALRAWLQAEGLEGANQATEADLARLREVRTQLREVFAVGPEAAVELLNRLLASAPVHPEVSGHDEGDWHLHLAGDESDVADRLAAGAAFGLTVHLLDVGFDRRGRCDHEDCVDVYIDGSRNRSRRYCSQTCSNRANVAAYRARKRAAEE